MNPEFLCIYWILKPEWLSGISYRMEVISVDLRNNQITIGELLLNPKAKMIARREFLALMNPFMLSMAKNMTLQQALKYAEKEIPQNKINRIIAELKAI